jgi:predicted RND superfamily exporter protein
MFERLTELILAHRRLTALGLALVLLASALGVARLGADFSVRAFYSRHDPEAAYLETYLRDWGEDDMLLVVADGGEDGLLTRERLRALDDLATSLESVEGVGRVVSVTRVPRVNRAGPGVFVPVPLLATVPPADAAPERVEAFRSRLLADPALVPSYLSADGRYGVVMIALSVDTGDLAKVLPVVEGIEGAVLGDTPPGLEGVRFHVAGIPAIRADVLDVIVADQVLFVPISAALMGLLLLLLFRSRHGVLIPAIAAGVPMVMLLGAMGWTGESFGLLNQVYLALVPAIALADAIHLVARYHEEGRLLQGDEAELSLAARNQAIVRAMGVMGVACFLTSFTTIVGFGSLLTTAMPVLQSFGVYASLGVAFAYLTVLVIVPLALTGTRSRAPRLESGAQGPLGALLAGCARLAVHRPWAVVVVTMVLLLGALVAGSRVTADWRLSRTFAEGHPTTIGNRIVDDALGGLLALELDLRGAPGAMTDPAVLAALSELEDEFLQVPGVRASVGVPTLVRAASTLVGGPYAIPADAAALGRLLRLVGDTDALSHFASDDGARGRLLVRTVDMGAIRFLEVADAFQARATALLEPHGVTAHLTGSSFVSARGVSRVVLDLRDSLVAAFAVIGVIITVLFRSVRLGVVSLLPNALPLVFGYGLMGLLGIPLEPGPAVVFTIAVGVSVDSAIHIIARYREERLRGREVPEAVEASVLHSGRAVTMTALILIVGFAVNGLSESPQNGSFGRLGTVLIASALLSNLLLLPALLRLGAAKDAVAVARSGQPA